VQIFETCYNNADCVRKSACINLMKHLNNAIYVRINKSLRMTAIWHTILIYAGAAIVMLMMTILLFGSGMQQRFDHDENLYCTAGALITSGQVMYKDFAYLQMPLLPVIYAFLFTLFKTTNYLFAGRVFSVTCSILTMFLVLIAFIHASRKQRVRGVVLGISATVLYSFNPEILYAGSKAWNHSFPILCILLAYLILASLDFSKPFKRGTLFLVGFLNGIAVFTRISFAFAGLVFFLVLAFFVPVSRSISYKKLLLPFLAGATLPSVVAVYYFFQAPDSFIFDTIQYFRVTGAQRWLPGLQDTIDFKAKLVMSFNVFTHPSYLALLMLFVFSCILAVSTYNRLDGRKIPLVLSSSLAVAMVFAAFLVTPMHVQYFAAPIPFLLVTIAYAVSGNISAGDKRSRKNIIVHVGAVIIVLSAIMVSLSEKQTLGNIKIVLSKENWTPSHVYDISKKIAEIAGTDKLILTLAPIFALEGGERIYPELSSGPFLFRYGRFLSDSQRHDAMSIDSHSLPALLQKKPPDAILVGVEYIFLEDSLIEYAEISGWQKKKISNPLTDNILLYVPVGND
jgi:hypothetical protein